MIKTAMVMAAGHGTRMRPLTDNTCKALVRVGGKALIDHMLDRLDAAGVKRAVVNVHAFADQLEAHLKARKTGPEIIISDEREELLETGGGVVKALSLLRSAPILICNIDAIWIDPEDITGRVGRSALETLLATWNPDVMDELLLLADRETSLGYHGVGDFDIHSPQRTAGIKFVDYKGVGAALGQKVAWQISRRKAKTADYVYAGVQIFKPDLAQSFKPEKFSRNLIWDETLARQKLFGCHLSGYWMHVGDPEALKEAEMTMGYGK